MKTLTAADVMSRDILAVSPGMTIEDLAAFFAEHQITGAPVLDRNGRLAGVVSQTDIAEAEQERAEAIPDWTGAGDDPEAPDEAAPEELHGFHVEAASGLLVRDIMTPTAYTVPHDTPVADLARTMVTGRIHRLLVTRAGPVVGIVTTLDLLKVLYDPRLAPQEVIPRSVRR